MFSKAVELVKKGLFEPAKVDIFLESRLFSSYSCNDRDSFDSFMQLLKLLRNAFCIHGGYELIDAMKQDDDRIALSVGLFYIKIQDIPLFIRITQEQVRENRLTIAKVYVPTRYKAEFVNSLPTLFPVKKVPQHYILDAGGRDWIYERRLRSIASIGDFDTTYGNEKPLVDEVAFQELDTLFNRFNNQPEWYAENKKPRKEVIMLYGPPGTGKTSVIRYLITIYKMHLIEYSASVKGVYLIKLLNELQGEPAVVLIEDIDAYHHLVKLKELTEEEMKNEKFVKSFNQQNAQNRQDQSYSDFLNLLEGLKTLKNCILMFTTNYPELLKPPIYRMGRVTARVELNYPAVETVRKFLGYRVNDKRWTYLMSIEDKRLPLDAIYRIRNTKTVNEIKTIIDDRNVSLTLKDKQSYE